MYKNFSELIKAYRKKVGITQTELANLSGISQSYIGDLEGESKKAFPTIEKLKTLSDVLTTTPEEKELFLLEALSLKLPINVIDKKTLIEAEDNMREVKIIGYVSAGKGYMNHETEIKTIRVAVDKETGKNIFAMEVRGDSMEPEIAEGSTIIVDPDITDWDRINNKIAVVSYEDNCYVKKIILHNKGTLIQLKSINKNYDDMIIPSERIEFFRCCGKVIKAINEKIFR